MFNNLSKPITENDIREIEQKLGIDIPTQLAQHYLKYNGGRSEKNYMFSEISGIETIVQVFLPMKYNKKKGFKYLGSVTVYSHLQACGIINDHNKECDCYKKIVFLRKYMI